LSAFSVEPSEDLGDQSWLLCYPLLNSNHKQVVFFCSRTLVT